MIVIRNKFTDEIILEMERDTLKGADLISVDLRHADLRHADLRHADLRHADLRGANLYAANLFGANLIEADLGGANLKGADLTDADLIDANLIDADLRNTQGIYTFKLERDLIIAHASQVQIGCEKHSIDYWLDYYKEIGDNNEYTAKQIEIYGKTLELIKLLFTE